MYKIDFTVTGSGSFPYDMLRYDACFPIESNDAAAIYPHQPGPRTVKLRTYSRDKTRQLTPERWESFGWKVLVGTISVSKV